ncbi:MAG: hypothetical protein ABIR91_03045, partial [Candidatus Saccharimonadales bacterium]
LIPLAVSIVNRHWMWRELFSDWLFRLIAIYAALHVALVPVLYQGLPATLAGLAIDLRYVLYFGLVYVLVRVRPDYRVKMLVVAAIGAMIVVGFGVMQLFLPADILKYIGYSTDTIVPYLTVDQNHDYIRINSTLRGPNPLGAYVEIVLATCASVVCLQLRRLKTPTRRWVFSAMVVGSSVVLWVSYSRSALVAAFIAIGVVVAVAMAARIPRWVWASVGIVSLLLVGGMMAARDTPLVSNVIFHEDPNEGGEVNSNDGHVSSLVNSTARVSREPFGVGIGSTGSASLYGDNGMIIENQYLYIAHESGWLGIGLFLAIFYLVMQRAWRQRRDYLGLAVFGSGIGMALIGLLLPVWADDTVSIVWWGVAGVVCGSWYIVSGERKGGKWNLEDSERGVL